MPDKVRVAVCGAGDFGRRHLAAYARRHDVELVGVADPDPDRAREAGESFAVAAFDDSISMVRTLRPDAVSVVTATEAHAAVAAGALDAGSHVLLEKPVATSAAEAVALAELARRSGRVIVPAHILRFTDSYRDLHDAVATGAVGTVRAVVARRDRPSRLAVHYAEHPALLTMIHDIDQVLWLARGPAATVRAVAALPRVVLAQVEMKSGVVASLTTAYCADEGESDRLDVYGDGGVRSVDAAGPEGLDAEVDHFLRCVREETASSVIGMDEAVEGLCIAEAVVRSAARGGEVVQLG